MTPGGASGRRRRLVITALVVLAVIPLGLGAGTARFFVWPASTDNPAPADAVVVLSGDNGERLARALPLVEGGTAPTLVLAGRPDFSQVEDLCRGGQPFEVVCPRPEPDSTRAEARAVGELARARHWKRLIVVTTTVHVTRAGVLFRRCFRGSVQMVAARRPGGQDKSLSAIAHEWLGLAHAVGPARGC